MIIRRSCYVGLCSLRDILLLSRDVSDSFSGDNFHFIASMAALMDFCPLTVSLDMVVGLRFNFCYFVFFDEFCESCTDALLSC